MLCKWMNVVVLPVIVAFLLFGTACRVFAKPFATMPGPVTCLAGTTDRLAVATQDGETHCIVVLDYNGKELRRIPMAGISLQSMKFIPNTNSLVAGGSGTIYIADTEAGTYRAVAAQVPTTYLSVTKEWTACSGEAGKGVVLLNSEYKTTRIEVPDMASAPIAAFSADGASLVVASPESLAVYPTAGGDPVVTNIQKWEFIKIRAVSWSKSGPVMVVEPKRIAATWMLPQFTPGGEFLRFRAAFKNPFAVAVEGNMVAAAWQGPQGITLNMSDGQSPYKVKETLTEKPNTLLIEGEKLFVVTDNRIDVF